MFAYSRDDSNGLPRSTVEPLGTPGYSDQLALRIHCSDTTSTPVLHMNALADQLHTWYARLWEDNQRTAPRWLIQTLRLLVCTAREIRAGDLTLRAMSLVYTTLLALVPLLALSFSLFKALGIHNQIEPMLLNLLQPLGDDAPEVAATLLGFVDNVKIGVLGSIGVAMLFYTVLAMIQKVEGSFNHIWNIPRTRPLGQRISQYFVVLLLGPLALSLILGVTATLTSNRLVGSLLAFPAIGEGAILAGKAAPFLMICGVFSVMFMFVPNTRVRWRPAILGGLVSGVLWQSATWAFAAFVAGSGNYNAVYSSFAILIVLLIWLYVAWLILLVGCQMAFYAQNPEYLRAERQPRAQTPVEREALMLDVLVAIGKRFNDAEPAIAADTLARELQAPPEHLLPVVEELLTAGVLAEHAEGALLLARAPQTLPLIDMPERWSAQAQTHRPISNTAVGHLREQLESARAQALGAQTLADVLGAAEKN